MPRVPRRADPPPFRPSRSELDELRERVAALEAENQTWKKRFDALRNLLGLSVLHGPDAVYRTIAGMVGPRPGK